VGNKRNTVQRQFILDALKELNSHATAEQVYRHVVEKHPSISKATVYRNLSQMAKSGELLNAGEFDGASRYDHNCHNHYHFICDTCKRIFDVDDYFPDICNGIKNTDGFDVTGHHIIFNGLCWDCKAQEHLAKRCLAI